MASPDVLLISPCDAINSDSSLHTVDLHKLTVPVALNVLER